MCMHAHMHVYLHTTAFFMIGVQGAFWVLANPLHQQGPQFCPPDLAGTHKASQAVSCHLLSSIKGPWPSQTVRVPAGASMPRFNSEAPSCLGTNILQAGPQLPQLPCLQGRWHGGRVSACDSTRHGTCASTGWSHVALQPADNKAPPSCMGSRIGCLKAVMPSRFLTLLIYFLERFAPFAFPATPRLLPRTERAVRPSRLAPRGPCQCCFPA